MKEHLTPIYQGLTVFDAQGLADQLGRAGIEAFTAMTDSPMYGITAGPQSRIVLVRKGEINEAREVVAQWEADGHPGVPRDEWIHEETGLELPVSDKPSDDDPNENIEGGTERRESDRPGAQSPEVEDLLTEPGEEQVEDTNQRVVGFGVDRPLTEDAEVESPEVEDQPIDQLHYEPEPPDIPPPSQNPQNTKPRTPRNLRTPRNPRDSRASHRGKV